MSGVALIVGKRYLVFIAVTPAILDLKRGPDARCVTR